MSDSTQSAGKSALAWIDPARRTLWALSGLVFLYFSFGQFIFFYHEKNGMIVALVWSLWLIVPVVWCFSRMRYKHEGNGQKRAKLLWVYTFAPFATVGLYAWWVSWAIAAFHVARVKASH